MVNIKFSLGSSQNTIADQLLYLSKILVIVLAKISKPLLLFNLPEKIIKLSFFGNFLMINKIINNFSVIFMIKIKVSKNFLYHLLTKTILQFSKSLFYNNLYHKSNIIWVIMKN